MVLKAQLPNKCAYELHMQDPKQSQPYSIVHGIPLFQMSIKVPSIDTVLQETTWVD